MEEIKKLYYSIGEVATIFSTTASRIRFYEEYFELGVARNRKGNRSFTEKDIYRTGYIIELIEEGYTLKGVYKKLNVKQ
jgi:DNA-binding transcriptional MerR regulator